MATQGINFQGLPYREMEKLRQVQCGAEVCEILAVRGLFSETPLGIHKRRISPLLFLTPYLPGFLIGWWLNSHALELLQLDRALSKLGLHRLSDSELKQACYLRGFCSEDLDIKREWLAQWLQVSSSLKVRGVTSFALHYNSLCKLPKGSPPPLTGNPDVLHCTLL